MDVATETLYSSESPDAAGLNSAGFKLARLARAFRKVLITNPAANISIVGYLSKNSMDSYGLDANLSRIGDRIKATRDRLTSFGVWEKLIAGYLPLQAAPITEDLIVVTARDTPTVNLFPGIKPVPAGDESIDSDAAKNGRIVVDPFLPPAPPKKQIIIGYTLIPKGLQAVAPIDPANPLRTLHQFSFTITRPRHPPYAGGPEDSIQGSVTFDEQGKIFNIQAGVQEALVSKPLLEGWIQASGFVQLMVSANWSKTISGQTVMVPAVQGAVGGQILVTPPYKILGAQVQIGIQGMGTANLPAVPPPAAPFAPGPSVGAQGAVIVNVVLPKNWL
jgi:hypothetical protein